MSTSDREQLLLKGLASNEKEAIEVLYKENYGLIQSLILQNNGSEDDARDIFQEGLIVLYEKSKMDSFALNCQIRTYLFAVCKRIWLKRLQQQRRFEPAAELTAEPVAVEEDLEMHEKVNRQYNTMRSAMGKIGEPCKSLLEAYYVHHKNMQEIAAYFGYTNADNAKNQKYKCLMRLKKLFFAQYKTGN